MEVQLKLLHKLSYFLIIGIFLIPIIGGNVYIGAILFLSFIFILLYYRKSAYNYNFLGTVSLLSSIILIGAIQFNNSIYDYLKDIFYFSKPIVFFILGYILIQNISLKIIIKIVINLALIFAVFHIIGAVYYLINEPLNIEGIRNVLGKGYILEIFALYFLLLKKDSIFSYYSKYDIFYIVIILTSYLLYFSRTNLIILFILLLLAFPKISFKKFYYFPISFVLVAGLILYNIETIDKTQAGEKALNQEKTGAKLFFEKIGNSRDELFSNEYNKESNKELYEHWRSYEAKCAMEQTENIIIGNGFGSLVDIHQFVFLGKENMRFIPILHNGYAYLIFKTGILGCIVYVLFIVLQFWRKKDNGKDKTLNYFQNGIAVSIALTTFVITGIYNKYDLMIFFLGIVAGLQIQLKSKTKYIY